MSWMRHIYLRGKYFVPRG